MRRFLLAVAFLALGAVALRPLWLCEYPPLTDLPEHALATSVIAHLHDPALRFDRSYDVDLFGRPTAAFFLTGAALTKVLPLRSAVKAAVGLAMLSVPLGLLLLLLAARKDPALAALGFVPLFGTLLHWGFVSYVLAAGVYLGTLAALVRDLERPGGARFAVVVLASLLLFFTHVWGVVVLAATAVPLVVVTARGVRAIGRGLSPLLPCGTLSLCWWLFARPPVARTGPALELSVRTSRLRSLVDDLSGGLSGPGLAEAIHWAAVALAVMGGVVLLDRVAGLVSRRVGPLRRLVAADTRRRGVPDGGRPLGRLDLALLTIPLVHLALYVTLPMEIGGWWLVYPREAFFVAVTVPAALPVPTLRPLRLVAVLLALCAAPWPALEAGRRWPEFDRWTVGFDEVVSRLPQGADVMSLVAATRAPGPYAPLLHFGAWAHALRGGRPAWSFAVFGASPVFHPAGREPPELPRRWEWTATTLFRLERQGRGWDHFLVGHAPVTRLFRGHLGREVEVVAKSHEWAYVRRVTGPRAHPGSPGPVRRR